MATHVVPNNVSYVEDAETLRKACQGWGTNEKAIISVLAHRTAAPRKQIRIAYAELYQEDLVKRLESELSGDFEREQYTSGYWNPCTGMQCWRMWRRKSGDYDVIVELSCVHSPEGLLAVRRTYQDWYGHSLEEYLAVNTSEDVRKFLVGLVTAYRYRYQGNEIDAELAKSEADILHEAIKDKAYNHEEVIRTLTTRNKTQLIETFNHDGDRHGSSISKALLDGPADEFKSLLYTAVRCLNDHKKYYEKVLWNAIIKAGTDEDAIARVIVTRAEWDLAYIEELYYKKNSVSLDHAIATETSGDYKAFLLVLLGKED